MTGILVIPELINDLGGEPGGKIENEIIFPAGIPFENYSIPPQIINGSPLIMSKVNLIGVGACPLKE